MPRAHTVTTAVSTSPERLQLLNDTDVLITSYPRSGSYWIRNMLFQYFFVTEACEVFSPRLGSTDFFRDLQRRRSIPVIIKTHAMYEEFGSALDSNTFIVLFRSPSNCLASDWNKRLALNDSVTKTSPEQFFLNRLQRWQGHANSYLQAAANTPERFCFISYESARRNTLQALSTLLRFLAVEPDSTRMEKAITACAIENVRDEWNAKAGWNIVGPGDIEESGVKQLVSPEVLNHIEVETSDLWERLQQAEQETQKRVS